MTTLLKRNVTYWKEKKGTVAIRKIIQSKMNENDVHGFVDGLVCVLYKILLHKLHC